MSPPTWTVHEPAASGVTVLGALGRYRYAVAIAVVIAAAAGFVGSSLLPPVYTATASIYLSEQRDVADPGRHVREAARRLESRAVADAAIKQLGGGLQRRSLDRLTTVESDDDVGTVTVSADSGDADRAAEIANALLQAYERQVKRAVAAQIDDADELVRAQQDDLVERIAQLRRQVAQDADDAVAQQQLDALQGQLRAIQNRIGEVVAEAAVSGSGIDEIEQAVAPDVPSRPRPARNAAILGLLGLALATAAAYWRCVQQARATTDPVALLGAPLLAQIPDLARGHGGSGEPLFDYEAVEAFQFLLSSFEYAIDRAGTRSVLVTSPSEGDGKSLTALHLARALSIQGRDVVLVDADVRARGLTRMLNAQDKPGLVECAEGKLLDDVVSRYRISPSVSLSIVPAGRVPPQPTGLLATAPYRDAIAHIIERRDLTIIDGAPLLTVADAMAVASQVAGVLLVIDARTTEADLRQVAQRLRLLPTPVIGLVVNRADDRVATSRYGATPARAGDSA